MTARRFPARFRYGATAFDFDGVLCDSVDIKTSAFRKLYESEGAAVMDAVAVHHEAHGGISRYEKIRHYEGTLLGRPVDEDRVAALANRFAALVEEAVIASPWWPGAREVLEALRGRCDLFIVSATPEEELRRIVAARNMGHHFVGLYGAPHRKADALREILKRTGLPAGGLLMIGDAMTDHQAATEVGADFLGVCPQGRPHPFPPGTTVISDLRGLLDV